MDINWFTVIAQVLNFFILVWLLKRFLYKPILKAIDEREDKIAAQLKAAELKKSEAEKEQEDFQEKNDKFDKEKKDRLAKVVAEADDERKKLMDQAREEAHVLWEKLAATAKSKQHDEQLDRNQKIQKEVLAVSRKVLIDLASLGLEEQLNQTFIKRLQAMKGDELKEFKKAFSKTKDPLLIKSALAVSAKQQKELKLIVNKMLAAEASVKFEVTPALIGGIELSTQDFKLAWSISEYLSDFEKSISKASKSEKGAITIKEKGHV
jgi:F-type H+-transporting ATPase subunit b